MFTPARIISSLSTSLFQQIQNQSIPKLSVVSSAMFHTGRPMYNTIKDSKPTGSGSKHGGLYKRDYRVLKERPVGPHKKLPPADKYMGRIGPHENYRRILHYPKDGKYTINKLPITKLGGRDTATGRKIIHGVGGGSKQMHRWIDWMRLPRDWPRDGPDLVEKVISINYDPTRKPKIALTGYSDKLRWQIATSEMKEGDLIRTSWHIPDIPIVPPAGDSYPLGAISPGTKVCLVQKYPDSDEVMFYNEGTSAKVMRKIGGRVIIENAGKLQYSLDQTCQCVVGEVSVHPLKALHIGSPNRMRWLGIKQRSGLWHRKTGRFGRKIRALPPVKIVEPHEESKDSKMVLTCPTEGTRGRLKQKRKSFPIEEW